MSIFDSIEKLITEHGSAAILSQQLAFARDQFGALERKVSELQTQVARFESQLERESADHKQAREELQRLQDEHAEDVCIHKGIEFRRGKRTGQKWIAFCPQCHMPAKDAYIPQVGSHDRQKIVGCSANCDWRIFQEQTSAEIAKELET